MEMSKLVIIHDLKDENARPALERWFRRYHVPEVIAQGPWTVRYLLYRCVPPPPGAQGFGYFNYRVHENWVLDRSFRRGSRGLLAMTQQPGAMDAVIVNVPAEPTEDFLGAGARFDDHTILRWLIAFRYPDGVSPAVGDDWYLNVHVPELLQVPGLNRFFSHKAYIQENPLPQGEDFAEHDALFYRQWHRLTEMWFDNNEAWVKGIIDGLPPLTRPSWANHDSFPFLTPGSEFVSTFILESPDADFTRDGRSLYL
jgi:hypothetical protein